MALMDSFPPQYTFRQVVVRNNLVRNLSSSTHGTFYGIALAGAENALVEGNVVDIPPLPLPATNPIYYDDGKSIHYFNNQDPAGELIQGARGYNGPKVDELAIRIEDALALCL